MARKKIKMTCGHHLPDEIITWILVKLPVKTLIRFQCVCKHWKNLIKTPYFITQQLQHSKNITYRTVFPRDIIHDPLNSFMRDCEMRALPDVLKPPSMRNLRRHASFIGGCNGLICVLSPSYASLGTSHLFLWNPSTKEVRQLPGVVNGKRGAHYFGFGFDPIANDYKIVKVLKSRRVIKHVEVYSLKTDSWRKIEFGDTLKGVENFYSSAYVNGSIVWCVLKSGEEKYGLILFDTAMEVFTHMPMPMPMPDFEIRFFGFKVCMFHRKLILVCYLLGNFYFWSMKEDVYAYGAKNWRWKYVGSIRPSRKPSSKSSILWKLGNHYHTYAVNVVVRSLVPVINIQRDDVSLT